MQGYFERRVSPLERGMLALNEIQRFNVEAILEGTGSINIEKLQEAVIEASAANPAVQVRLKGVLGFMKWVDDGQAPSVSVITDNDWDGYSSKGASFLESKFDALGGGSICDVMVIKNKSGDDAIVFRALHAAMDARGLLHWMYDVFRAYNGEKLIGSESVVDGFTVMKRLQHHVTTKPDTVKSIPPLPVQSAADCKDGAFIWQRVVVPRMSLHLIPKLSLFIAEFARQHNHLNHSYVDNEKGQEKVSIRIPVDFRSNRNVKLNSLANLVSFIEFTVDVGDSPRDIMRKLKENLDRYWDCYIGSGLKIIPWVPMKIITFIIQKAQKYRFCNSTVMPTAGISSMGKIQPKTFKLGDDFQCTSVLAIPSLGNKLNVVSVDQGKTSQIIFLANETFNKTGLFDQLIEEFCQKFDGKSKGE